MQNNGEKRMMKKDACQKRGIFFIAAALLFLLPLFSYAQVINYPDVTQSAMNNPQDDYKATQLPAEVGRPVQWTKQVDVQNLYDKAESDVIVNIPADAKNVAVTDINTGSPKQFVFDAEGLTIKDTLGFNEKRSYLIKYETPSPDQSETALVREGEALVKNVIISSDHHYEDVLTYTNIPKLSPADAKYNIVLYWTIDGVKTEMTDDAGFDLTFYDTDGDGNYDRISWITPHLSTQIFEVVIYSDADPGNYSAISLNLLSPADGEYITSNSRIGFNYSVSYNSSTTVLCNLTVDGQVKRENIPTAADVLITTYFNISSGNHTWYANCAGSDGAQNTSTTRRFTVDLDSPVVTLNTPDYHVSYTNSVDLNFTPVDEKYPVMVCALSVNGALNQTNIVVNNATKRTLALSGLSNGVYDWNVSCSDAAGNRGSSEERVFYISTGTPSEFNISPNKNTYSIGETGYLIINAKAGSNLTLFVDAPLRDSFFKYFNGVSYPLVEMLNFTNNAGTYNIDGIFNNAGQMYIVKTSFEVTNTFYVEIDANETSGIPGDTFNFEANATGGIGGVTYEWDFDDGNVLNGTKVEHSFGSTGEYTVEVTATDSKGNKIKDVILINIYRKHSVDITVRELQTQNVMASVAVEVDDERKYTDDAGNVHFEVYEGKRRIYIAHSGYEWIKQVRNITENLTLTIELNNTAITNYTPPAQKTAAENATVEAEKSANDEAERLLTLVSAAIETLNLGDDSTKAVLAALSVDEKLQQARKSLRQIIRDLSNAEQSGNMTSEQKASRVKNITRDMDGLKSLITSVSVEDTTEYVDYPKSADISMLSAEYLRYKNLNYTKSQKEKYLELNTALQDQITIETRIAVVKLNLLSGDEKDASVVINKITKQPAAKDTVLIEYIPKEVAGSASEIKKVTEFTVVKSDPILEFDSTLTSYAYYVEKKLSVDELKKTKHVLLNRPAATGTKGMSDVTGFSILSLLKPKNPKLAAQILVIAVLFLAYLFYHFELLDRIREWRANKQLYNPDMAYKPQSTMDSISQNVRSFVLKEEELFSRELTHIRTLMMAAHSHAENRKHEHAAETYTQIMSAYKELPKEAKGAVYDETKQVFNKVLLSKIEHLIEETQSHIASSQHVKARSRYSEIKKLYAQLETEHRASVSERCIQLHQKLFEQSLA